MHISHPNVLELLAVNIDPKTGALSMISELMENGNIVDYIRANEANRIRLVRHSHHWGKVYSHSRQKGNFRAIFPKKQQSRCAFAPSVFNLPVN